MYEKNFLCSLQNLLYFQTLQFEFQADAESQFGASRVSLQRERKELVRPLSRKDIFYSGSVVNLPEYQSQKSLANYRQSVVSLPRYGTQTGMSMKDVESGPPRECLFEIHFQDK